MKFTHLFAAAAVVAGLWGMPAQAMIALPPRPGPAPFGWTYRYVAPVYQTVTDRTWIAERTQTTSDWVEVGPGRWEQVLREIVIPGHYEFITRQVLVAAGYWQLVQMEPPPVVVVPLPRPVPMVMSPGTVGVEGYSSGPGEDLSKFSGLSEWPK